MFGPTHSRISTVNTVIKIIKVKRQRPLIFLIDFVFIPKRWQPLIFVKIGAGC
jgi:hypothetical protein